MLPSTFDFILTMKIITFFLVISISLFFLLNSIEAAATTTTTKEIDKEVGFDFFVELAFELSSSFLASMGFEICQIG